MKKPNDKSKQGKFVRNNTQPNNSKAQQAPKVDYNRLSFSHRSQGSKQAGGQQKTNLILNKNIKKNKNISSPNSFSKSTNSKTRNRSKKQRNSCYKKNNNLNSQDKQSSLQQKQSKSQKTQTEGINVSHHHYKGNNRKNVQTQSSSKYVSGKSNQNNINSRQRNNNKKSHPQLKINHPKKYIKEGSLSKQKQERDTGIRHNIPSKTIQKKKNYKARQYVNTKFNEFKQEKSNQQLDDLKHQYETGANINITLPIQELAQSENNIICNSQLHNTQVDLKTVQNILKQAQALQEQENEYLIQDPQYLHTDQMNLNHQINQQQNSNQINNFKINFSNLQQVLKNSGLNLINSCDESKLTQSVGATNFTNQSEGGKTLLSLGALGSLSQLTTISKLFQRNNSNQSGAVLLPSQNKTTNNKNILSNLFNQPSNNATGSYSKNSKIIYNDSNFNITNISDNARKQLIGMAQSQALINNRKNDDLHQLKDKNNHQGHQIQKGQKGNNQQKHKQQQNKQQQPISQNKGEDCLSQRYEILHEVGKGAFGSVSKAIDKRLVQSNHHMTAFGLIQPGAELDIGDHYVAIKKLFYDRRYEQRELTVLDEIKRNHLCTNIIELKDRYFKKIMEKNQKKEYLFIVTDYLPYTICDLKVSPQTYCIDKTFEQHPQSGRNYCLESIKQVMFGVFQGLRDLHQLGITHRDIKLSNILISNNEYPVKKIKICDLGSSKKLISDPNDETTKSLNYIGTRSFRAPELLVGNRFYDIKIDIWSAGIVFLKLILKYINKEVKMFEVDDTKSLAKVITDAIGEPTKVELKEMLATNDLMSTSVNNGISDQDILKKRFKKLDQLIKKEVPVDCLDLIHKIFQLSPVRRISANEALSHYYFTQCYKNEKNNISSVQTKQSLVNRTTETTSPCTYKGQQ